MTKVDGRQNQQVLPWTPEEIRGPSEARKTLAQQVSDAGVDADLAVMMGEFLARLDDVFAPGSETIQSPDYESPTGPPAAHETMQLLQSSCKVLGHAIQEMDASAARRVGMMIQTIEEHLSMKREVLIRAQEDPNRS